MRSSAALLLFSVFPSLCQNQATKGACSPVVSGNNNRFTFYCDGLSAEQGKQLLDILNRIAKDQLDPKAVMKSLDEIKALAARGGTSPEVIAKGMEMYASGQELSPRAFAQKAHEQLTAFLDRNARLKRQLNPQQNQLRAQIEAARQPQEQFAQQQIRDLQQARQLSRTPEERKQIDQRIAQIQDQVAAARNQPTLGLVDFDQQTVDEYLGVYARSVTNGLAQLRSKHVNVDNLWDMNKAINSVEGIVRLAEEFKRLADILARQEGARAKQ